ncbi:hypothetical protein SAMN05216330_11543 [Bradyrhizobium sp. Ghvi]|nr:hypothetical protein SAMN05216330_11543 [Bradyrhizobium sp. Ghvi]
MSEYGGVAIQDRLEEEFDGAGILSRDYVLETFDYQFRTSIVRGSVADTLGVWLGY